MAMERKQKAAAESGALLLIAGGILVAANVLSGIGGYARKDVTKDQRYSLSKGSGSLLRSMKQEMKVEAYVTRGLPKLDAFERDLRDMLTEYKQASGGKLDFVIIEPKTEEEKKAAKDAGVPEVQLAEGNEGGENKLGVAQGYMGLVLKYGTEKDVLPLNPGQTEGLEFWITNKIRELRDKGDNVKHKVGVLTGHDEIKLTEANLTPSQPGQGPGPSIQQIILQKFPFYEIQEVDLKGGEGEVPEELDGLIITQPGKDLTEKELRRIDAFVLKGKSLAVFAGAANVKASDASMQASLNTHGLEKLLDGYGIELRKDVVVDFGLAMRVPVRTQMGATTVRFPQVPVPQEMPGAGPGDRFLDTSFVPFFRSQPLSMPFPSSVIIHKEKQPDLGGDAFRIVARTSPRSLRATTDSVDLRPFQTWESFMKKAKDDKQAFEQYGIAAAVEGTLGTAFPSGDKMGINTPAKAEKAARVMVVASPQFFANPFARAGNGPDMGGQMAQFGGGGGDKDLQTIAGGFLETNATSTLITFKNSLDWLSGDSDLVATAAKIQADPPLVYEDLSKLTFTGDETDDQLKKRDEDMKAARKKKQNSVGYILTLGLPLLFAIFGFVRRQLRMKAREDVSLA